jgi:hypothetical protein
MLKRLGVRGVEASIALLACTLLLCWAVRCFDALNVELCKASAEVEVYFATLRFAEQLDAQFRASSDRAEAKAQIVNEFLQDKLPLCAAARRFANVSLPISVEMFRRVYPDESDDVLHCRMVLEWAEPRLQEWAYRGQAQMAGAVRRRFESELVKIIARTTSDPTSRLLSFEDEPS